MPKKTVSVVGALVFAAGALSFSVVEAPVALQATQSISIKNLQFNPGSMDMAAGDTVTWTNNETDGTAHNINSDDGRTFRAPQDIRPGETFSFTPSSGGTFGYHCNIHPQTTGTLNVSGPQGEPPPPPPPSDPPPPPPEEPGPSGPLPALPGLPSLPGLPIQGAATNPLGPFADLMSRLVR